MKLLLKFAVIFFLVLFAASCEESVEPKSKFDEEFVLYSFINADTTFQSLTLSRTYNVNGLNGLANSIDPAIEGAVVKYTVNDSKEYLLNANVAERSDTARYKTPFKFYSLNNFQIKGGDVVKVTALLPTGKVLNSVITIPFVSYLGYTYTTEYYDPNDNDNDRLGIEFRWRLFDVDTDNQTNYFIPHLDIIYSKLGDPVHRRIRVPMYVSGSGNMEFPVYPNVSAEKKVLFLQGAVNFAFEQISAGDSEKGKYIIHGGEFTLLYLDKNLAYFLSSQNLGTDDFSIRLDPTEHSNINNGLGIFGGYTSKKTKITIADWYIESFGYQVSQ